MVKGGIGDESGCLWKKKGRSVVFFFFLFVF
jgi:hypothetical protein